MIKFEFTSFQETVVITQPDIEKPEYRLEVNGKRLEVTPELKLLAGWIIDTHDLEEQEDPCLATK